MNKKTVSLLIIVVALLAIAWAIMHFAPSSTTMPNGMPGMTNSNPSAASGAQTSDGAAVDAVVSAFGMNIKNVSLTVTQADRLPAIESAYGQYVDADLMVEWEKGTLDAPGEKTATLVPDHIVIDSTSPQSDGTYVVEGKVAEASTAQNGSIVSYYPVTLTLADESGRWYITKFTPGTDEPVSSQVTIRGTYSCLANSDRTTAPASGCTLGLKSDDGLYYALDFSQLNPQMPPAGILAGDRVQVDGLLVPLDLVTDAQWHQFDVTGVITADTVAKL